MCFIYTMEYYLAIKNEDIMSFAGKWMELENILSEVTQIQKDMYSHVLTNNWILAKKKQYIIPRIQHTELKKVKRKCFNSLRREEKGITEGRREGGNWVGEWSGERKRGA